MDFWNSAYSFLSTNCSIGGQWIVHNAVIFLSYTGVSADVDMDNHPSYLESLVWPNEVIFPLTYANDEVVQSLNNCWNNHFLFYKHIYTNFTKRMKTSS